jgi:NAD(P)H-dependent FMN reductase
MSLIEHSTTLGDSILSSPERMSTPSPSSLSPSPSLSPRQELEVSGKEIQEKTEKVAQAVIVVASEPKTEGATIKLTSDESVSSSSSSSSSESASNEPRTLIISTSLRDGSRSRKLALKIEEKMKAQGLPCEFLDMTKYKDLPHCDAKKCYGNKDVQELTAQIKKAHNILLCFPIYNYDCNSVAKNLIDVTGKAWEGKVVGMVAAAGSPRAFMAPLNVANALMINSECVIVPKYVFADPIDFPEKTDVIPEKMSARLDTLIATSTRLAKAYSVK